MRKTPAQRQAAYRERNRELVRKRDLERYHRTKHLKPKTEQRKQYETAWAAKNREKMREYSRKHYYANRDRIAEERRLARRNNTESAIKERGRGRAWYRKNRIGSLAAQQKHQSKRNLFYWTLKSLFRCMDCGEHRPACLDFHHRNPEEKCMGIGQKARTVSREALLAEVMKCDVICANCHRHRHYQERGGLLCERFDIDEQERQRITEEAAHIYDQYQKARGIV